MFTYGFRPWLKKVGLFLKMIPTDFLIRDFANFTVPRNANSEKKIVRLVTPSNIPQMLQNMSLWTKSAGIILSECLYGNTEVFMTQKQYTAFDIREL